MKKQIRFIKYLLFHPIDGFWEMKREQKGSFAVAVSLILLLILSNIFERQATGFLFSYNYSPLNLISEIRNVVLISGLFCVSNWAVTTLLDGESTMKDIVMTFGYSIVPLIIIGIPVTIFSNFATFTEAAYMDVFEFIAAGWALAMIYVGIMTINQYSPLKTFLILGLTVIAMAVIVFIYILFFSIINQLAGFAIAIFKEISLRLT
jgi:hypothetical protein